MEQAGNAGRDLQWRSNHHGSVGREYIALERILNVEDWSFCF